MLDRVEPTTTTSDTTQALTEIQRLEQQIADDKRRLAELRRSAPNETVDDHVLRAADGDIRLSELFGDRDELVLIHNMGGSCSYCTLWADGFNGLLPHLEDRAAFVVVSPDAPDAQRTIAETRGWNFAMASSVGTNFHEQLGSGSGEEASPGVSTFVRASDGSIERVAYANFGPGDNYCPVWDLFDLLPESQWGPKQRYES